MENQNTVDKSKWQSPHLDILEVVEFTLLNAGIGGDGGEPGTTAS